MSLQEAASSGSFNPRAAQTTDPQRQETAFTPPLVGEDVAHAEGQSSSPFANPYDFSADGGEALADGGPDDMRAKRRRAWTVVSLAIVVPAAVAAIVAWQLFGSDGASAPTVTRVTTAPAESVAEPALAATTAPAAVAVTPLASADTPATAETSATVAAVTTSEPTASEAEASTTATVATEQAADLSSLDPASRLAAWTEIETIEVLPGETLWLIAQNYGTTISAIATLNGITDVETLSVGQELMIPVGFAEEIVQTTPVVSSTTSESSIDSGSIALTAGSIDGSSLPADLVNWHTIAPVPIEEGDSLEAIANANNTSVQAIMALNGITDSNLIYVGEVLLVPVGYQGEVQGIELNSQPVALATSAVEATLQTDQEAVAPETGTSESTTTGENDLLAEDEQSDPNSLAE